MAGLLVASAQAAELKANTAAAFDHYIRATEAQHADDLRNGRFLAIDGLPDPARQGTYARLHQGQIYIEQLHTKEEGRSIPIPGGLVHHWVGVIFIPGATLSQVLAVLQNYDNHKNVYKPDVRRSKLLERNGSEFRIYLQFYRKAIVTVVINANFDVHYTMSASARALSQSYSTRIAEMENPDKPDEHELPVGHDHGYLWRLDNYWRIEEKDGGTYVQVESVGLSRSIPAIFAWLINPLVRSIPRSVLSSLLTATRRAVVGSEGTRSTTASWSSFQIGMWLFAVTEERARQTDEARQYSEDSGEASRPPGASPFQPTRLTEPANRESRSRGGRASDNFRRKHHIAGRQHWSALPED